MPALSNMWYKSMTNKKYVIGINLIAIFMVCFELHCYYFSVAGNFTSLKLMPFGCKVLYLLICSSHTVCVQLNQTIMTLKHFPLLVSKIIIQTYYFHRSSSSWCFQFLIDVCFSGTELCFLLCSSHLIQI
jgi:hypothetical protein